MIKKLIVLLLAALICVTLVACGGECKHTDSNNDGKCDECGATVDTEKGDTGGDLVLISDSKTKFAIVSANSLSSKTDECVVDFMRELNKYYIKDQDIKLNYDVPGFDDVPEIIFGSVNYRGDAFKKDEHYLGYEGFSIELIGNKLFVLGGGDKGYQNAIDYIAENIFTLDSYGNNTIDNLVIKAGTKYESIVTDHAIKEFTIGGKDISTFVISYDSNAKDSAVILRDYIYKESGTWLPYVAIDEVSKAQNVIYVEFTKGDAARTTEDGCTVYLKNGDLHIECEFENKFEEIVGNFIDDKLSTSSVKITSDYTFTKDVRNIYYRDFGAVGDGMTDDFFALKECHDYANEYGHTVNADRNATYYIGRENGTRSIIIKTDTYWNCCSFIWDDRVIDKPSVSKAYQAPIFKVTPDQKSYTYSGPKRPVTSLAAGATVFGDWKPGERVMVVLKDYSRRHYIRYGGNQNNGSSQNEIIIVNPDGTIDPTTPVQWDYTDLTEMTVYPINDTPITISGGTKDQVDDYSALGTFDNLDCIDRTVIYTYFNDAPSEYKYHARNIDITRSNVTIKNLQHVLYDDVTTSAPYTGFIKTTYCSDVVVEGMLFQKQKSFSTIGAGGGSVGMGSYEISANHANNVVWRHCRISNFFNASGSVSYKGYMGTNYCKNLMFDDVVSCSFDAHCGLYNGTIKDSTCEHLNFIGAGTIYYKNVTVYTDGGSAAMHFREDYGSTWCGNVIVDGLTLRTSKASPTLSLISAKYTNHYFGYTCHLPETIEINNVKIIRYGYKVENGVRTEWDVATNHVPLHIYAALEKYKKADISDPKADMSNYPNDFKACNCETVYEGKKTFNDGDFKDGRCENDLNPKDDYSIDCWGFRKCSCDTFNDTDGDYLCDNLINNSKCMGYKDSVPKNANANPYVSTKKVYVTNCGDLKVILPDTPQFEKTEFYIDGVSQKEG